MSRNLSGPVATGIAQKVVPVAIFVEFSFASGFLRAWSGYGAKTWDGHVWTGTGEYGSISSADETSEIGASGLAFQLSGVPNSLRALALSDAYRNRPCKAWLAILDGTAAYNVLGTYQFYGGRMDVLSMVGAGQTSTLSIKSENRLIDLFRPRSTRYTAAEQQRLSPGDTSLIRTAKLSERPLPWGVASAAAPAATAPSYSGYGSDFANQYQR